MRHAISWLQDVHISRDKNVRAAVVPSERNHLHEQRGTERRWNEMRREKVVHTQAMRGHGRPACCRPRRLGEMGPDERLQQNVRWRIEVRGAGMRQSATRQQREILHRGEEEIDHLQHQSLRPEETLVSNDAMRIVQRQDAVVRQ